MVIGCYHMIPQEKNGFVSVNTQLRQLSNPVVNANIQYQNQENLIIKDSSSTIFMVDILLNLQGKLNDNKNS